MIWPSAWIKITKQDMLCFDKTRIQGLLNYACCTCTCFRWMRRDKHGNDPRQTAAYTHDCPIAASPRIEGLITVNIWTRNNIIPSESERPFSSNSPRWSGRFWLGKERQRAAKQCGRNVRVYRRRIKTRHKTTNYRHRHGHKNVMPVMAVRSARLWHSSAK